MRAGGYHRHQGACHFVLALRASLKALVALFDAPLQRLVVAGLKVQAVNAFKRAPVPTVSNPVMVGRIVRNIKVYGILRAIYAASPCVVIIYRY